MKKQMSDASILDASEKQLISIYHLASVLCLFYTRCALLNRNLKFQGSIGD